MLAAVGDLIDDVLVRHSVPLNPEAQAPSLHDEEHIGRTCA